MSRRAGRWSTQLKPGVSSLEDRSVVRRLALSMDVRSDYLQADSVWRKYHREAHALPLDVLPLLVIPQVHTTKTPMFQAVDGDETNTYNAGSPSVRTTLVLTAVQTGERCAISRLYYCTEFDRLQSPGHQQQAAYFVQEVLSVIGEFGQKPGTVQ